MAKSANGVDSCVIPSTRKLLAEMPNEVWSWDITKLMGPAKWSYFYLYVILDIFSRRVVGRRVADAESATLFRPLFKDAIAKHNVPGGQLTLHADRGGPMKAKATASPPPRRSVNLAAATRHAPCWKHRLRCCGQY